MGLEERLAENTAAMKDLTSAIIASNDDRKAALAQLASASDPAPTRRRGRPPGSTPAPDPTLGAGAAPEPPPAAPPVVAQEPEPDPEPELPLEGPSELDVRAAAASLLDTSDQAERVKRKLFVKAVIDHLGAETVIAIAPEDRTRAIGWFADAKAGKPVNFDEDSPAEEPDPMLG